MSWEKASWTYLAVGLTATVVAAFFGVEALDGVAALTGLAIPVAVGLGLRRFRPSHRWVWIGWSCCAVLFIAAGALNEALAGSDGTAPYPNVSTYLDLATYAALVLIAYRLLLLRVPASDKTAIADSLIGVGGVAVLIWVYVMVPYLRDADLAVSGRVISGAFSVLSLTLTMVIARLSFGPGIRSTSYRLLAITAVGALSADLLASVHLSGRAFTGSDVLESASPTVGFVAIGAAALHPTMVDLTTPAREVVARMSRSRWAVMFVSALVPPLVIWDQIDGGHAWTVSVVLGCWIVLTCLIVLRLGGLVRAREQLAEYDRILSKAAAALVGSTERSAMLDAALEAAHEIVGGAPGTRLAILEARSDGWLVERTLSDEGLPDGRPAVIEATTLEGLSRREAVIIEGRPAPDGSGDHPVWSLLLPLVSLNQLRGALVVSRHAAAPPDAQDALRALAADVSLAVESAALTAEMHRQRSERRFRALVENSTDIVAVVDGDITRFVSPAASRLLGYAEDELVESPLTNLVKPDQRASFADLVARADGRTTLELQLRAADGTLRWFETVAADMTDEPEVGGVVVTAREITERKRAEIQLARSEARFRALVQRSTDVVAVLDEDGIINYISPSVQHILGHRPDQVVNRELAALVAPGHRDTLTGLLHRLASAPTVAHRGELEVLTANRRIRVLEVTVTDLRNEPAVAGIVVNAHDVTERKRLESDLRHQALHDDLTGLPNRVLFRDRVQQALSRRGDLPVALIVVDLDDFRTINDGIGMHVGDELLKVIAFRLEQHLRVGDTASRLGGDEFAVLLESEVSREAAMAVGKRILDAVKEPIEIGGRELVVSASLGVVFAEDVQESDAEVMLRSGEMAMYSAKSRGKARIAMFDRSMHEGAFERLELKTDLAHAIERNELSLNYQPILDLRTGRIVSFEALMRWRHPERGMVSPASFIPLAEETGLIVDMGRWLLEEACRQLRIWQDEFPDTPPLGMSVNLSARQLEDDRIVADVAHAIARAGVPPESITIELTESVLVDGSGPPSERLEAIRNLGVNLVADDFGSGYASYAALQQMPFTGFKLDMSLIEGLTSPDPSNRGAVQVRSLIDMAERTGLSVVAEGVECAEQVSILTEVGCRLGQGYYFARPDSPDKIGELLRANTGRTASVA